ncbi:B3 domain-containing protein Os12g0591400 isoform X2 [Brachypodium distachyon]|uniref:TF-B3 domain-containing protein n=1 Tax=Brachypodium distachyon TaxID=15368 RepID=A0A0Q3EI82_BRADI|nr:B3 domain-containing protein Os12g0591400 isoform X2 [Brachypodium distachyon]KQJ86040.1 hypothetical protein BRADI_4g03000v3 [Brachypodium distachyon]KQJ86041.1 hypothetical protein BRADI_4g03000v3 [Brachypodium distachyon]KQJ86042.1 hypothetical protein BRADI_4g03000v3 [Brachypodium distachyon]KQJ86043.1 hypothetical protein BRADI_4g03000v3 [Brachypodium distachyon]KQJ86044.1 hypothetical protein BRADI_4g03000v3 [Brachypodium distachyon]|eukprot:XP_014758592.1 B3 domain-containing protein Os12g0591400 isoform X2 [Brachypodium distachyon]
MAGQDHEQDDRSGHNISSRSCQRCEHCYAHYYWCHLDDTRKYFFECMVGDFHEKMIIPRKFVENFKGQIAEVIKLEAPDGNIYNVHTIKDLNKIHLGSGWASFANLYELKEGYMLVFRYIRDSHFKVLIFDYGSCCEKEVFHVVMNRGGPDAQEGTHLDQSPPRRSQDGGPSNGESHRRCEWCDAHYYWHHLDDRQKHFFRFMVGNFRQEMSIPEKFVNNFRGHISEVIKVEAPDGNVYSIQVTKDLDKIVLGSGWAAFADTHELKEHDVLVFRYIGDSHFKTIIFEPNGCEKELFHVVMNRACNVGETGIFCDQPVPKEARCRYGGSHDNDNRKSKKKTPLHLPSPRSAEGVASSEDIQDTMNSCGLQETAEPLYVLAKECNLTTEQKAEVGALVKKNRPGVPFYITALNKTSLSESLVICKAYAVKHLPHEDQPITLCHPQSSKTWDASFRVIIYGTSILPCITSTGWLEFVQDSKLQEGDICIFEISKSDGRVIMVIHSLEGGYHPPSKEPESQNNCEHLVKGEATDQDEESDDEHAEPDCYYSRFANYLTAEEQEEIFGLASIQLGNPVYVTVLCKSHVRGSNNMLVIHNQFAAKHLAERSHDILLL